MKLGKSSYSYSCIYCYDLISSYNLKPCHLFQFRLYCSVWIIILIYKFDFYVHVTVHRNKFLLIKPTDALISQIILSRNSICFGQFLCPSSGVFHCTFSTGICHAGLMEAFKHDQVVLENCHQTCVTCTSAECTVENSWWWARGTARNI